jgi:hypothetical protein
MEVPDLLVALVFVVDRDQVGDFGLGEVVIITEALNESPDLVLCFVAQRSHFGVVSGVLRNSAKGCRSEVDTLEEHR